MRLIIGRVLRSAVVIISATAACDSHRTRGASIAAPIESLSIRWTSVEDPHGRGIESPVMAFSQSRGRTVALDAATLRVVQLDSTGRVLASVGGRGEGPSEFLSVSNMFPAGTDTVGVWDPQLRRLSVFDEHLRLVFASVLHGWSGAPALRVIGRLRSGEFVGFSVKEETERSETADLSHYVVTVLRGDVARMPVPIVSLAGARMVRIRRNEATSTMIALPETASARSIAVCGNDIVVLDTALATYSRGRQTHQRFRIPVDSVTGTRRAALLQAMTTSVSDSRARDALLRTLNATIADPLLRPRRAFIVTIDDLWFSWQRGGLALERHVGDGSPREQMASPTIVFPLNTEPDRVYGVRVDSVGVAALVALTTKNSSPRVRTSNAAGCGPTVQY